ncbi:MAG: hypothetical protein WCG42_09700, partial [Parachlamydiaceae bacterium]
MNRIIIFILTSLIFFGPEVVAHSPDISVLQAKGVQWRCKRCGGYNYSEIADWEGHYYCTKCGACKGE